MKKKTVLVAAAGVAAVLCVGCLALALLTDALPAPEATVAAEATELPMPMDTPASTEARATAAPTDTPTPAMLTVRDIEVKRKELTDLQWESYSKEVVGEWIRFAGEVMEVYDSGRVQISEGKGLLTGCILHGIPLDVAAALDKDQFVQGIGTVRDVDTLLGLRVHVNVEEIR